MLAMPVAMIIEDVERNINPALVKASRPRFGQHIAEYRVLELAATHRFVRGHRSWPKVTRQPCSRRFRAKRAKSTRRPA